MSTLVVCECGKPLRRDVVLSSLLGLCLRCVFDFSPVIAVWVLTGSAVVAGVACGRWRAHQRVQELGGSSCAAVVPRGSTHRHHAVHPACTSQQCFLAVAHAPVVLYCLRGSCCSSTSCANTSWTCRAAPVGTSALAAWRPLSHSTPTALAGHTGACTLLLDC